MGMTFRLNFSNWHATLMKKLNHSFTVISLQIQNNMGEISPVHNYSDAKLRLIKEFISKNRHAEDKYGVLIAAVVSNQNDVVKYLLQSSEFCHDKGLDGVHHRTIGYSLMTISTSWQTLTLMEILMDIGGLNPNNADELGVVPMHAVTGLKYVPFALEKLVLLLRSGARTGMYDYIYLSNMTL